MWRTEDCLLGYDFSNKNLTSAYNVSIATYAVNIFQTYVMDYVWWTLLHWAFSKMLRWKKSKNKINIDASKYWKHPTSGAESSFTSFLHLRLPLNRALEADLGADLGFVLPQSKFFVCRSPMEGRPVPSKDFPKSWWNGPRQFIRPRLLLSHQS